jgi:hypothetical protein
VRGNAKIALAVLTAGGITAAMACFPEVGFGPDATSGGSGGAPTTSSSTVTTSGTGGHGATSSSSTASSSTASSSAASSSAASSSAASSSAASSSTASSSAASSSGASSSGSVDAGCTIDDDGDGVLSWKCAPADPTKDCADEDGRAFPDAGFEATQILGYGVDAGVKPGTLPFDFNCDGEETKETPPCVLLQGVCPSGPSFQSDVACGTTDTLGTCNAVLCLWTAGTSLKVQRCK